MSKNKSPKNTSKITKLTETTKRRNNKKNKSVIGPNTKEVNEGDTPEDVIVQFTTGRKPSHEAILRHHRFASKMFMDNIDKIPRLPIPIQEGERVKLDRDLDFFSGQCIKYETIEYTIVQAPTKQNQKELWRYVWDSQVPVIACLCHDDQMTEKNNDKKCFQYFPNEEKKSNTVEFGNGKIIITCTKKETMSYGANKYTLEMTTQGIDEEEKANQSDAPGTEVKAKAARTITLIHALDWTGKQEKDPFESAHNTALLANEIVKTEVYYLGKSLDTGTVHPALIQSFDGTSRAGIIWVALYLCRESNKRDCFDIVYHIKKIMKSRPGCFSNYYQFCYVIAVSLWIAKDLNWMTETDFNTSLTSLTTGFAERKLNEYGNPI